MPFAHSLKLPVRFLFPRAPAAVPGGGYAWWDVDAEVRAHAQSHGPRDLVDHDPAGRTAARTLLVKWLDALPVAFGELPLVLGGFSQGGMLATDTLLMETLRVRALVLMSSSRIAAADWSAHLAQIRGIPVLVSHGEADADLAYSAGLGLADTLREAGGIVTFVGFPQGHEIPLLVWRALRRFVLILCDAASETNDRARLNG